MPELLPNLGLMVKASWEADRARSLGAFVTTALLPVTRPLRAIGLGMSADGIVAGSSSQAVRGALVVAVLTALNRLLEWASLTIRMRLREHTVLLLDQQVMDVTTRVPGLEHHERPEHRDKLELLRLERGYLVNPFMPIAWTVSSIVQLVTTVIVLAAISPWLALLPVFGLPALWAAAWSERRRAAVTEAQAERSRLMLHLLELATKPFAAKEVRLFGLGPELVRRHEAAFREIDRMGVRFNVRTGLVMAVAWGVFAAGYMGAVGFVVARVLGGGAAVGAVVVTFSMGAQLTSQLAELVGNTSWFSRTTAAVARYRWLLRYAVSASAAVEVAPAAAVPVPTRLSEGIRLSGVDFTYPGTGDRPVLGGVDLFLPAGSIVAVVGENGAGKTTLVKLLCRFYEPTAGTITVDGVPLSSFDLASWRAGVSAGFQDFARFQFVARDAVGVGRLADLGSERAALGALERAAAGDLAGRLPDGLATQLGRDFDGVELSIGQWQKVALGRAMMRPSPLLLVLDEPTASLDAHTEHELFERYSAAAAVAGRERGAVTILVSHRFSTVRLADLIVVVAGGRVAEAGSHAALVAAGGLYAELFALQASSYA